LAPKVAWYPRRTAMAMATAVATRRPEPERNDEMFCLKFSFTIASQSAALSSQ
jgi:hypothetical protein